MQGAPLLPTTTASRPPWAARTLLGVSVGAILYATLTPSYVSDRMPPWWCVACGDRGIADFILNVILFIPLGVSLRLTHVSRLRTAVTGGALSTCIELAQALIPGRDTTIGDVISNTAGALIGFWLADLVVASAAKPARLLPGVAWVVVAMVMVAVTGLGLAPDYPPSIYYGQWTPDLDGGLEWYRGHLGRVTLGDMPVASQRLPDQDGARRLLKSGAPIELVGVAGAPPSRISPLFSIYDNDEREILLLAARREDIIIRYRTRSLAWHLDRPYLTMAGALSTVRPGDSLHVTVIRRPGRLCVKVQAAQSCELGFTPGAGWSILIYPESLPAWLRSLLGALWVGGILLPAGFYVRSRNGALVVLGLVVIGLVAVPPAFGLLTTPLIEWVGAVAGIGAGFLGRYSLARGSGHAATISAPMHRSIRS